MKKSIVIASTALVAISLAACSNQSSSSKNTSDNVKTAKKVAASSSKPQTDKFNNNEYGVMGYLMLSQTDASKLANAEKSTGDSDGMKISKNAKNMPTKKIRLMR